MVSGSAALGSGSTRNQQASDSVSAVTKPNRLPMVCCRLATQHPPPLKLHKHDNKRKLQLPLPSACPSHALTQHTTHSHKLPDPENRRPLGWWCTPPLPSPSFVLLSILYAQSINHNFSQHTRDISNLAHFRLYAKRPRPVQRQNPTTFSSDSIAKFAVQKARNRVKRQRERKITFTFFDSCFLFVFFLFFLSLTPAASPTTATKRTPGCFDSQL